MTERDAFVAAICAAPDDDLRREVFADWLDERNDPLGRFIRLQLAAAKGTKLSAAESLEMRSLRLSNSQWVPDLFRVYGTKVYFERGFVYRVSVPAAVWSCRVADDAGRTRMWGAAAVLAAPLARVDLTDKEPHQYVRGALWQWHHFDGEDVPFALRSGLFERLLRVKPAPLPEDGGKPDEWIHDYSRRSHAVEALRAATLLHGRELAGIIKKQEV